MQEHRLGLSGHSLLLPPLHQPKFPPLHQPLLLLPDLLVVLLLGGQGGPHVVVLALGGQHDGHVAQAVVVGDQLARVLADHLVHADELARHHGGHLVVPTLCLQDGQHRVLLQRLPALLRLARRLIALPVYVLGYVEVDPGDGEAAADDGVGGGEGEQADLIGVAEDEQILAARPVGVQVVEGRVVPGQGSGVCQDT